MFKNRAGTRQVSAHLESQLLGRLKWGDGEVRKGNHMSLKGKEVSKVKSRNENAKTGSKSQMPKSRYLLGLTLISHKVWLTCSLLIFSARLWSGRIPSDVTPSDSDHF